MILFNQNLAKCLPQKCVQSNKYPIITKFSINCCVGTFFSRILTRIHPQAQKFSNLSPIWPNFCPNSKENMLFEQ